MKNIETLTLDDAKKAVSAMEDRAKQLKIGICFCAVDGTNNIILLEKMDDTKIHSINLSRAKATTAISLKDSTENAHKLILELKIEPSY
jgi:cob(I)alamin adenosyltransferase